MDLRQLRYFKMIAEAKSFARGGRQLGVAQPALSRSVAKLEDEIGQPLFVRHSGGVTLTEAGSRLYRHVVVVLREMRCLTDEMAADMDAPHGAVALGIPPSMQSFLTAPVAAGFVKRFPNINLSVIQNASLPLREAVANGQIDVAVVTVSAPSKGLHYTPLFTVNYCLIGPVERVAHFGNSICVRDLVNLPLILCGYPDALRLSLEEAFALIPAKANVRCEVNNGLLVVDLVAEGAGLGLGPCGVLSPGYGRDLIAIPVRDLAASFVIATSIERVESAAVRHLRQMIVDKSRTLAGSGNWATARFDGPSQQEVSRPHLAPHLFREFGAAAAPPLDGLPR